MSARIDCLRTFPLWSVRLREPQVRPNAARYPRSPGFMPGTSECYRRVCHILGMLKANTKGRHLWARTLYHTSIKKYRAYWRRAHFFFKETGRLPIGSDGWNILTNDQNCLALILRVLVEFLWLILNRGLLGYNKPKRLIRRAISARGRVSAGGKTNGLSGPGPAGAPCAQAGRHDAVRIGRAAVDIDVISGPYIARLAQGKSGDDHQDSQ